MFYLGQFISRHYLISGKFQTKITDYAPLQRRATNSQTTSRNFAKHSIEFTYSDNLKVNRDKLALINRPWTEVKKKDERLNITANFSSGLKLAVRMGKSRSLERAPLTVNQIQGFSIPDR